MTLESLFPAPIPQLALLAVTSSLSPGANSLLIAASSARFGVRRSLLTMGGMYAGSCVLFAATAFGIGAIFATTPWLLTLLQWAGAAYVMYLAIGLLRAQWHVTTATAPIGFARAALLQFLYPKLWLMAIATVALCTQDDGAGSFLLTAFFLAMTLPGMLLYLSMGRVLRALAESPRGRVGVNRSLAAMTALSALLLVMPA